MKTKLTVAAVLIAGHVAHAAPATPVGTHADSKIGTAVATSAAGSRAAGRTDDSIVAQAKSWVQSKWASVLGSPFAAVPSAQETAAQSESAARPRISAPAPTLAQKLSAPVQQMTETSVSAPQPAGAAKRLPAQAHVAAVMHDDPPGLERRSNGVAVYDLSSTEIIPRLHVGSEKSVSVADYSLDAKAQSVMNSRVLHPFPSPDLLLNTEMKRLTSITTGMPLSGGAAKIRDVVFGPKGKVSRADFDKIVLALAPERPFSLTKFKELTTEEIRFLSGLLLFQQGDKCPVAVGLFHKLSLSKGYESEADYYLAMCSRKLGLTTDFYDRSRRILESQDVYYSRKILKEIGNELPYEFTSTLGLALFKASSNAKIMDKLDASVLGDIAFNLATFGASTERFKTALEWSKKVPATHSRYLQARFIEALSEYQTGNKDKALKLQEELIANIGTDRQKAEFQALVALNVARMYFQEQKFKPAHEAFLKVYKDHPMWLQSLTELGWSQLMSGDFEGAIGNMYSIQSPFFSAVYKPESYVIRTIGYLNLCQYGDAYKALSMMEHEYKPSLTKMESFIASKPSYYQTVRQFMGVAGGKTKVAEVNGLPLPVIREMARHRDFTNLQKALNRQADERDLYAGLDGDVSKNLKRAQGLVTSARGRITRLRLELSKISKTPALEGARGETVARLDKELDDLNDYFFQIDLFNEAKAALPEYRKDVIGGADSRLATMRGSMEKILSTRLLKMKTELSRYVDNNELLRYEVFSGAGENIRYQVSGGSTANRVAASVVPKSKSLQWDFDGEYWEDEIGHYRSGLKNNCAGANGNVQTQQANLEGEE